MYSLELQKLTLTSKIILEMCYKPTIKTAAVELRTQATKEKAPNVRNCHAYADRYGLNSYKFSQFK